MQTASLENCKKLYELTKWSNTYFVKEADSLKTLSPSKYKEVVFGTNYFPAYDLGYLIRKLPESRLRKTKFNHYWATYANNDKRDSIKADSPEDACAQLLIKLIESGELNG